MHYDVMREPMIRLRVKEVAQEKGFSLGRLSRASDVAYNTVKAIYRNPYKEVTTTTLNKLAAALGVPASELIEDVQEDSGAR
jgi:DNA-binding Xre family transcriptional regulator